jgi:GNAT superfamily N-acetyltransferase
VSNPGPDFRIVPARRNDVPLILEFIRALAEYEKMSADVVATEDGLAAELFGPRPAAQVLLAYEGDEPVGFALFFHNFSTFLGKRGIYLEDLFVKPEHRGKGYGKALLAALAGIAVERGCRRLEWAVLDWNEPSIAFYRGLGAKGLDDWRIFRLTGDALARLAATSPPRP